MTEVENVFEKYRRFANELDDGIDHVIGEYRTVNSMYRTTDEPTYWKDKEGKVKTRYYNMLEVKKHPEKVFLDFVNFYSTRDEIERQRKIYQDIITNEANKYIGQINDYQLKVIKEINEIKEKYNVHSVA